MRAVFLDGEDADQDGNGDRHDVWLKQRRGEVEAFDRAEHRDRWRDHAVAVQQGRAKDAEQNEHRTGAAAAVSGRDERCQREDATLARDCRPASRSRCT